jgi:hypothetical protein
MSLTPRGYAERKWRGLSALQYALSGARVDDRHYGFSTADYNKFEEISDLLEICTITIDNIESIRDKFDGELYKEIYTLAQFADEASDNFRALAEELVASLRR